jgi:hypothetical protein
MDAAALGRKVDKAVSQTRDTSVVFAPTTGREGSRIADDRRRNPPNVFAIV